MFLDLHTVSGYDGTGGTPVTINADLIATVRPAGGATVGSKSETGGTDILLAVGVGIDVRVRQPYHQVIEWIHEREDK